MVGNVWLYAVLLACTDGFEPRGPSAPAPADDAPPFPTSRTPADWPFSAASPWNFPVGSGLTLEDPDAPCTRAVRDPSVDAWVNAETWSHPIARAASTDPVVDIWEDGAFVTAIAVPPGAQPSLPAWPDGDAHLHVIDPDAAQVVEVWHARPREDGGWDVDSLAFNDLRGTGVGTEGVRIYGGSGFAGLWRAEELTTGAWHALALSLPLAALAPRTVWPATDLRTSREEDMTGPVPVGAHVALPQEVDLDAFTTPGGRALARTLRDYGAYVVDHARGFALYAEPTAEEGVEGMRADLDALRARLRCSTNNLPTQIGGPGPRVQPLAPDFVDEEG